MSDDKTRISVQIDNGLYDLLNAISKNSRVPVGVLVRTAVMCKMDDLLMFDAYIKNLPSTGIHRLAAIEALKSPGPHSLKQDLEELTNRYGTK